MVRSVLDFDETTVVEILTPRVDMVALDKACADLVNKQTAFDNSNLGENINRNIIEKDNFHINHPETNWESQIEHGEKIGLGNSKYELIKI